MSGEGAHRQVPLDLFVRGEEAVRVLRRSGLVDSLDGLTEGLGQLLDLEEGRVG